MEKHGNILLVGIIVGVILGALLGGLYPGFGREIKFIGDLFLHALMMMVVPLVMASMITGVAGLGDVRNLGTIGVRTVVFYMITTALAVIAGLIIVNIMQPGKGQTPGEQLPAAAWTIEDNALVLGGGVEFTKAAFDGGYEVVLSSGAEGSEPVAIGIVEERTETDANRFEVADWVDSDGDSITPPASGTGVNVRLKISGRVEGKEDTSITAVLKDVLMRLVPTNLFSAMVNMEILPIIVFSLVFGGVLTTMGARGKIVLDLFGAANDAIMIIIQLLMYFAPIGIFALIAGRLGEADGWAGFWPELKQVGNYALSVIFGLLFHACIILPLILAFIGRRNPLTYLRSMGTALTTAFSTASSSATLPITLRLTEEAGVEKRTSSFVVPLGATINMDGTALYEAVAAIFIANIYGIELGLGHQIIIAMTATLAAIGAAGIPEAGLVTMVIVLKAVDLPIEGITLILVIDWFLDRCRTTINVWGDSIGAAVIDKLEHGKLPPEPDDSSAPPAPAEAA